MMTRRPTANAASLRWGIFIAGLAVLGGCSFFSHATTWTKNGATEEQAHSDLATCKEQADVQTERDRGIDQDISTANSGGNAGIDTSPIQNMQSYHSDRRYKSILEDCMAQLGYQKVE